MTGYINGWQRVCIVLSAGWLYYCISEAMVDFPTYKKIDADYSYNRSQANLFHIRNIMEISAACNNRTHSPGPILSPGDMFGSITCHNGLEEEIKREKEQHENRMRLWSDLFSEDLRKLPGEQKTIILKTIGKWLIPTIAIYLIVPWLVNGFTKK